MNIGDKVRFAHQKGEGIIRKILDKNRYEIEIEDGFLIPVAQKEIVLVSKEESQRFQNLELEENKSIIKQGQNLIEKGFYLAFLPFNDKIYHVYLINTSGYDILYNFYEIKNAKNNGVSSGVLKKSAALNITQYRQDEFEALPLIRVQALYFSLGNTEIKPLLEKDFKPKASVFYKNKRQCPIINQQAYLFVLDDAMPQLNAQKIKEQMSENQTKVTFQLPLAEAEVDLHIDKLLEKSAGMSNQEMIIVQLAEFHKKLDTAIAAGKDEITFIHGVGTGKLRQEIHRILSRDKRIKFFKDANKEKFGYGATYVKLK